MGFAIITALTNMDWYGFKYEYGVRVPSTGTGTEKNWLPKYGVRKILKNKVPVRVRVRVDFEFPKYVGSTGIN